MDLLHWFQLATAPKEVAGSMLALVQNTELLAILSEWNTLDGRKTNVKKCRLSLRNPKISQKNAVMVFMGLCRFIILSHFWAELHDCVARPIWSLCCYVEMLIFTNVVMVNKYFCKIVTRTQVSIFHIDPNCKNYFEVEFSNNNKKDLPNNMFLVQIKKEY